MLNFKLKGFYSYEVIDFTSGLSVGKSKDKNNLILNVGLDSIGSLPFADQFLYCAIGSDTQAPLLTDTQLGNELERSNNYYFLFNGCGSNLDTGMGIFSIFRTFDFSVVNQNTVIGELGWANASTGNLFSKTQMIDANGSVRPVTLFKNQFLRVKYTLQIQLNPYMATSNSPAIGGLVNTIGNSSIQYIGLKGINAATGLSENYDLGEDINEPSSSAGKVFVSTNSTALNTIGSAVNRTTGATLADFTKKSYQAGSYQVNKYASFGRNTATSSTLRSVGIGPTAAAQYSTYTHVFDNNQEKLSNYELAVYFNYSWSQ